MIEEDHNVIRDYLLQFDGGKIELNKDLNTGVAYICLNHPERKNAISGRMMVDLLDCIVKLEQWKEGKAVIIYGIGNNFCSGGDLNLAKQTGNPLGASRICTWMQNAMKRLQSLSLLTLCIVHGPTLGAGAEISIFCDYILTTENVQYGFVEGKMGILTVFGAATRLSQKVGESTALDMLVTCKILNSKECLDMGIAQHIITSQNHVVEAAEWLKPRLQLDSAIIRGYKDIISHTSHLTYYEALEYEKKRFVPFWGGKLNVEALAKGIKHVK